MPTPAPSSPGYQQATLAAARTNLAIRLGDSNNVYWSSSELNTYIVEGLRLWQALTYWYRETGLLNTSASEMGPYYDLSGSGVLTPGPYSLGSNLLQYNVTDQQLLTEMCLMLIETPMSGDTWEGTSQFNATQVYSALQNRIWRFMGDTGVYLQYMNQSAGVGVPITNSRLYTYVTDVRRANWIDYTGTRQILYREDSWTMRSFQRTAFQPSPYPSYYSFDPTLQPSITWYPPSQNVGSFEILYVPQGPSIGGASPITLTGCPDDYCWAIKYGALAELLGQDAEVRDPDRAAYCEQRYQMGVELAKLSIAVQGAYYQGSPLFLISTFEADHHLRGWVNQTPGAPNYGIVEGRCTIAFDTDVTPVSGITLDVVRNFPVPSTDGAYLQVPTDVLDAILDYAQHTASFKMGGYEFGATIRMYSNFVTKAGQYNEKIRQYSFYKDALRQAGVTSLGEIPRLEIPELSPASMAGMGQ